jgi:hypothetical protein
MSDGDENLAGKQSLDNLSAQGGALGDTSLEATPQPPSPPAAPEGEDDDDGAPLDLVHRELCPDGTCIGVIGQDGRCKLCGTPKQARSSEEAPSPSSEAAAEGEGMNSLSAACPPESDSLLEEPEDVDLRQRLLCSDGACIGVVGTDGKCKLCGLPYSGDVTF